MVTGWLDYCNSFAFSMASFPRSLDLYRVIYSRLKLPMQIVTKSMLLVVVVPLSMDSSDCHLNSEIQFKVNLLTDGHKPLLR